MLFRTANKNIIFIACSDPGGCEVIARILPTLKKELSGYWIVLLLSQSSYARNIVPLVDEVVEVTSDFANLEALFGASNPKDILLCGTSISVEYEKYCIKAAAGFKISTFSIIDHWCHYRKRYLISIDDEWALPDIIFVPDKLAYEECIADGIDCSKLIISGHPVLDSIISNNEHMIVERKNNTDVSELRITFLRILSWGLRILIYRSI